WVPGLVAGWGRWPRFGDYGALAEHLRYVERTSRKLGRTLFYAMARFGPKLEKRQSVLFRLVDVGAELFAMSAVCVYAHAMLEKNPSDRTPLRLADLFCRQARKRIDASFRNTFSNHDRFAYRLAQDVLAGKYRWLEHDVAD
ncbi:MAG: acyl-CoA dehydrogenase domain-containing protein, partial [Longimicrobiales bacterium]